MEYWDNKGKVYNDNQGILNPLQKAYNKALATGTNIWDWVNETNPESKAYKQKTNAILSAELALLPIAKANPGINKLLNNGIDYMAERAFKVDDGIKRKFLTKEAALEYFKKITPEAGKKLDTTVNGKDIKDYSSSERTAMRNQWKKYIRDNYVNNSIDIPNYSQVDFTNKNVGKEHLYNFPDTPKIRDLLPDSKYAFSTNYDYEPDRLYDHMVNENNKNIYDYLIEVIQGNNNDLHHNYKMMKNINRGDLP